MKIDQSISQLLYLHDCVVVPDLGGFVANYKPATIQPIKNTLQPPSKAISFNKNLNKNDGLLANHIVQTEQIDYDSSCRKIEDYVATINRDLKLKKKVLIDDVGTLFLDPENRIQFDPKNSVNYLLDSYGLTTFQKLPLKQVRFEDKITQEFKDRTAPIIAIEKEKKNTRKWLVAAAFIPIVLLLTWASSKTDLSGNLNYANLNLFKSSEKAVYAVRNTLPEFKSISGSNLKEQLISASEDQTTIAVSFIDAEDPVIVRIKEKPTIVKPVSTYVETNNIRLKYHIIGGCFSNKKNAVKMVKALKKKGFNAWVIGKRKGLWTVSYNSFATRKEAIESLTFVKVDNPKAWILNQ